MKSPISWSGFVLACEQAGSREGRNWDGIVKEKGGSSASPRADPIAGSPLALAAAATHERDPKRP